MIFLYLNFSPNLDFSILDFLILDFFVFVFFIRFRVFLFIQTQDDKLYMNDLLAKLENEPRVEKEEGKNQCEQLALSIFGTAEKMEQNGLVDKYACQYWGG